ncbi:hypothetical protein N798_05830 [Knoellia flava TL1]|uniref:Mce-associated membrane protein n=2 Tax=Knoellia flava TaxID=913969 RepID=A0A8H9FR22_9MICO|nr:hypothetical protein [Knoellia flava]KGN33615.1 hypothetical protein N798_05830 [Knoellia flava TL1]GGB73837.1 hypothetical protein GCM10011314_11640 [Knoellia flava]
MSSSANRRPRVAGQRRRPARPDGPGLDPATTPVEQDESVELDEPVAQEESIDQDESVDGATDNSTETSEAPEPTRGRRILVPALALALSLALLTAVLLVTRHDPEQRSRDASAARATARSTLEQVLSYNHETMTQQIPANQALLTGKFKDEFAATMTKTIVPLAQKDRTVVKARAYEVGVMSQTEDTVVVQAFVNQARTSDTQKEPSIDQNRVIATMTHVGNRWLVSALKAY